MIKFNTFFIIFIFFQQILFGMEIKDHKQLNINSKNNIKNYILQCDLNNETACDNLFFEYIKKGEYDKAAKIGWDNFYKGYYNTLPYMADLITTNKTKYKNCKLGLLLLEGAIKQKKCEAFRILSNWYKEGRCTHKPNIIKSKKYYNFYLKCKHIKIKK